MYTNDMCVRASVHIFRFSSNIFLIKFLLITCNKSVVKLLISFKYVLFYPQKVLLFSFLVF